MFLKLESVFLLFIVSQFLQEKLSVLDFVDKDIGNVDPVEPPFVESTPFKIVEEVKDLKELAAKLRGVNEFAVKFDYSDLCHVNTLLPVHLTLLF